MLIRQCRGWPRRRQGQDDRRNLILSQHRLIASGLGTLLKVYRSLDGSPGLSEINRPVDLEQSSPALTRSAVLEG
jgi:hypothetical protein